MDFETCPKCGRSLGLFLPDETPVCPGCGTSLASCSSSPGNSTPIRTSSKSVSQIDSRSASHKWTSAFTPPPRSPAVQPSPTNQEARGPLEDQPFLCPPLVAVLTGTTVGLMCLCPLSWFLTAAKGLIMLAGICQILGGFLWMGYRFKKCTGHDYQDDTPWFLRGGLATFLELWGLVVREPRVFGPPATVIVLGGFLTLLPIFLPGGMPSR